MSTSISMQTVAASAMLETLALPENFKAPGKRFGLNQHNELVMFKGWKFLLHPQQCSRARAFMKQHDFREEAQRSKLGFTDLKLKRHAVSSLIKALVAHRPQQQDSGVPYLRLLTASAADAPDPGPTRHTMTLSSLMLTRSFSAPEASRPTLSESDTALATAVAPEIEIVFTPEAETETDPGFDSGFESDDARSSYRTCRSANSFFTTDSSISRGEPDAHALRVRTAELWREFLVSRRNSQEELPFGHPPSITVATEPADDLSNAAPPLPRKQNRAALIRSVQNTRMAFGDATPVG